MRVVPKRAFTAASVTLALLVGIAPASAAVGSVRPAEMTADLDGAPIKLVDVGKWYCNDFDYPAIHCFSHPEALESDSSMTLAPTTTPYVTVYEFTTYQGAYMHMSQDYSILGLIGWNDRISSLVVHNSPGAVFWTDWLYSGTRYPVCCYSQLGTLGSYNDTFSSVFHN